MWKTCSARALIAILISIILHMEDNMTITRHGKITEKDVDRIEKYHASYVKLKDLSGKQRGAQACDAGWLLNFNQSAWLNVRQRREKPRN